MGECGGQSRDAVHFPCTVKFPRFPLVALLCLAGLSVHAATEQAFTAMLAGPNGYMENANGPWLSLVFGRDRALGAWAAEGFGDEQIDEACLFLLGACSCEVKRMNPGWDLLLNADWVESLRAIAAAVLLVLGSAASWFTFRRQP